MQLNYLIYLCAIVSVLGAPVPDVEGQYQLRYIRESFTYSATVSDIGLAEGDDSPIPLFEVARSPYDASTPAMKIRDEAPTDDDSPIPLFEVARSPYDASTPAMKIRDDATTDDGDDSPIPLFEVARAPYDASM
jgi:hypothetical protein